MSTSIRFDHTPAAGLGALVASRLAAATARALNRTAASEATAMARAVSADMGLKVTAVKAAIVIEKAAPNQFVARVVAKGKGVPLIEFGARGPEPSRGRGRGVTAKVGSGRAVFSHAFIGTMASGHRGVFQRRTRQRLPIRELFGPSIARVFGRLSPLGAARRAEVLEKNLQHEITFALSKLR